MSEGLQSEGSTTEPRPLHRQFVRTFIPLSLAPERRPGFLVEMSSPRATQVLQEAWEKVGIRLRLPPAMFISPAGMSASGFSHGSLRCFFIVFPPPESAGESFFGLVVAGPADDWSAKALSRVPVRYFILESSTTGTPAVFEWQPSSAGEEEVFTALGSGPSPENPPDFVEAILARVYGINLNQ